MADASSPPRVILERSVVCGGGNRDNETSPADVDIQDEPKDELRLLFLGCEENFPYGPCDHTATLFLDLVCRAMVEALKNDTSNPTSRKVSIAVYHVQHGDFPQTQDEWDSFDGVIVPGSFSSAYDSDPWILDLKKVIQEELVRRERPTLGVCFGHQLYAHSFEQGSATKCPAGPQAGRRTFESTPAGRTMFGLTPGQENNNDKNNGKGMVQLFYTHGDMVEKLPKQGVSLGGSEFVPIQSAAYFRTQEEAEQFLAASDSSSDSNKPTAASTPKPIAITFQAHPEYASPELGFVRTLGNIVKAMGEKGDLSQNQQTTAEQDAKDNYKEVEQQSIDMMIAVGRQFGWFRPMATMQ